MFAILNLFRLTFLALIFLVLYPILRAKSLYYFLRLCGPSFIKLGQALSARPDIVGQKLANVLAKFQDKVTSFSKKQAQKILKQNFGDDFNQIFREFDFTPKASASIAQVHKAVLQNGEKVAVKILRPKIRKITDRDIKTLKIITKLAGIFSSSFSKALSDINDVLKQASKSELNLIVEASMAMRLKKEMQGVQGFYVPKIYQQYCKKDALVIEWIDGIPFSNKEEIAKANFDKKQIAQNFVIAYFTQVYQNGFFHAEMHPGHLFLLENGDIAVVDFGIMGEIGKKLRIAIAEILIGYINKDYERVAKIHIDANLVPRDTNLFELSLSCQKIGEKMVGNSVKDISLIEVLKQLIEMTHSYKMSTKPELLLLQKTIILVEATGLMLDKDLNIWEIARPWVKDWAKKNIGFDAKIRDVVVDLFELVKGVVG